MNRFLAPAFAILFPLIGISCGAPQGEDEGPAPAATVTVQTASVTEGTAHLTVTAYGTSDALRKETISAPLAGKVVSLKAFEGTAVHKGDILAVLQTRESQSAILGAEGMLEAARTPEQKKEAREALELARSAQQSVNVTSRFGGLVASRAVNEGELVADNAPLFTIVDLSTVDFLADVPLHDVGQVAAGQTATITFQTIPDTEFRAIVDALSPASDPQSQTVRVRLLFGNMPAAHRALLRTEMAGTALIRTGTRPHALFVPKASLLRNDETGTYSVVTVTPDSLALHIPVSVGAVTDSTVEVESPRLRSGMPVITIGVYALADSTRVTVARPE